KTSNSEARSSTRALECPLTSLKAFFDVHRVSFRGSWTLRSRVSPKSKLACDTASSDSSSTKPSARTHFSYAVAAPRRALDESKVRSGQNPKKEVGQRKRVPRTRRTLRTRRT